MIKSLIKNHIDRSLKSLIETNKVSSEASLVCDVYTLERTKSAQHGDFAANIALLLAKSEKKPPRVIAELLAEELKKENLDIAKVEVAGPGFLNIFLTDLGLSSIVPEIAHLGEKHGKTMAKTPKKVLLEFVSANPTGGLHLGHARGAFVGDALARLMRAAGFDVTTEFYVNDFGNQVEVLARTIHKRYRELFGEKIELNPGEYPAQYVSDIAKVLKEKVGDRFLNKDESEWLNYITRFGIDYNLATIKQTLAGLDIKIDNWALESDLHHGDQLTKLVQEYENRSMLYEAREAHGTAEKIRREKSKAAEYAHRQEGGLFLKTSDFGDDEDRIIQRKDGRFVYLTADLCYHDQKFRRGYDLLIDVFGGDHAGHIARIKAGMQALGHDANQLQFVVVQMVRLLKNGQEVRFSKRAGEVFGIEDLIEVVGKDVARFVFLMRSTNSQFDLDLDLVLKKSSDNPVFYVQYGHARMATILEKAREMGIKFNAETFGVQEQNSLKLPEERDLILKMSELSDVVSDAAIALEPHRLIYYCQDLIKSFHSYFTKYRTSEKIISDDLIKTNARLSLVFALKQTIFNALSFLGLSAPDHMAFDDEDSAERIG